MSQAVEPSPLCPDPQLSRSGLRKDDSLDEVLVPLRKPVYILLQDHERAQRLAQQLEFFGLLVQALPNAAAFLASVGEYPPAAIIMDVDFTGSGQGLLLAAQVQHGLAQNIPLLFFSHHEADTPTRLAAVRAGGQDFLTGSLEASSLLEKVELLTNAGPHDPLRVLIIDDSRTQALHTERVLASAGMLTRSLTDPIRTMAELADFQPDLIILDLYMPACTGPELAKVIRHSDRYVSVPIIYLSAEDDLDKQLDALLTQVAAGNPVLLRYEDGSAWWGEPRYAVLIGYDRYKQRVLLRSGMHRRHMMAFDAFASAWAEQGSWAVLVQPPRQLPAEVDRQRWLQAAEELSRAGQEIAAKQAVNSLNK